MNKTVPLLCLISFVKAYVGRGTRRLNVIKLEEETRGYRNYEQKQKPNIQEENVQSLVQALTLM